MPHIDYYLATISPYTYLAGTRLEAIAKRHNAQITYKPLDIAALFARTGGVLPKDRHISRIEYRAQELPRQARKLGMPFHLQPAHWPVNMAPSSYALIAAQRAARGGCAGDLGALAHGMTRACWAEQKNIAEDEVIRACLEAAGFEAHLAEAGLAESAEVYERNLEEAVAAGVFGAPFYIADGQERFWGQDRLEDLDRYLSG